MKNIKRTSDQILWKVASMATG